MTRIIPRIRLTDVLGKNYLVADHCLKIEKFIMPNKDKVFASGAKCLFWVTWWYGPIRFTRSLCTILNGYYVFSVVTTNRRFSAVSVPFWLVWELLKMIAEINPINVSSAEFLEKARFHGLSYKRLGKAIAYKKADGVFYSPYKGPGLNPDDYREETWNELTGGAAKDLKEEEQGDGSVV